MDELNAAGDQASILMSALFRFSMLIIDSRTDEDNLHCDSKAWFENDHVGASQTVGPGCVACRARVGVNLVSIAVH